MLLFYLSLLETEEDRDLFTRLYEEQGKVLLHVAFGVLQQTEEAENVVHDTFLKLIDEFSKYRKKSYEELVKISITIAKRKAIDRYRHEKMALGKSEVIYETYQDHFPEPEEYVLGGEERESLKREYEKLPAELRDLLFLHFGEGYKPREIARILDMSSAEVSRKLYAAKQTLKQAMDSKRG